MSASTSLWTWQREFSVRFALKQVIFPEQRLSLLMIFTTCAEDFVPTCKKGQREILVDLVHADASGCDRESQKSIFMSRALRSSRSPGWRKLHREVFVCFAHESRCGKYFIDKIMRALPEQNSRDAI